MPLPQTPTRYKKMQRIPKDWIDKLAPPPGYPIPTNKEIEDIMKHNQYEKDQEVLQAGGIQFSTGAVRSSDKAGVRYDLITPIGLRRIAETYKEGYDKYGAFNWERGMPISDILNHAIAHIYQFLSGVESGEDDLAHAAWNLLAAMHIQETHPDLNHELRVPCTTKATDGGLKERSEAWFKVFDKCRELGMPADMANTGEQSVLKFIERLSCTQKTSE